MDPSSSSIRRRLVLVVLGYGAFAAALGKAGDKAAAGKHLMKVATGDFPRDLKSKAVDELKALGIDPKGGVKAQGFVVDWWVVSPIANSDGKAPGAWPCSRRACRARSPT